ncbi:Ubiquitin carboxyl-terminal hydrolase DUB-1 [Cricetulus griseus]|uniref:ubiquitinyl hydrolase 1 n=1 Tax=Cricetulus griseus TaxID=10029 RepID=G3IKP1_CRIGR|nr:Ubiquitin carboxyl-terminal hydrolase DUB-1 [Cricetulus griseus]
MEAAQRLSEVESPWKAGTGCKPSSHAVDSEVSSCSYGSADSAWSSPLAQDLHQDNAQGTAELAARGKHSASWERPLGVGVGLLNTGNSCYLNAALQCLTHTPPLANYMLSREHSQSCCHHPGSCTMCALEAQVNQSLLHSKDVMQPSKILTGAFHRQKQEDAHEFLMFTLNAMHKTCLRGRKRSEEPSKDSTPIYEIFGGSCEVASVLSESAYLLFYVQRTDGRGDSVNMPVGTGNKAHAGKGWQKKHKRGSCVQAAEPPREPEEAAAQAKSLDQWKVLEENKRPESGLNLKRPGFTPLADGVGIHRARSREDWDRNQPDKENRPWHDSSRFPPAPRAMDSGLLCSQEERARSKKKKKKPTWRPLPLY